MRLSRGPAGILLLLFSFFMTDTKTQFNGLPDFATLNGITQMVGDAVALDMNFKKCMQKRVCEEFSDHEHVEHVERYDPTSRSWKTESRVVREPGRLRWIGDIIATGLSKVARKVGLFPDPNRRNDGMMGNMGKMGEFASKKMQEIPINHVEDVMDFATDQTDVMDRNGNVYPIVKAAGMGYSIGHKKMVWTEDGPMQGCCSAQIGPDCGSFWDHVKEYNKYNLENESRRIKPGGLLYLLISAALAISENKKKPKTYRNLAQSRNIAEETFSSRTGKIFGSKNDGNVERMWYQRYFKHTNQSIFHQGNSFSVADQSDANSKNLQKHPKEILRPQMIQTVAPKNINQPIIVFEGLPPTYPDETEEELVGSILEETLRIPKTSVIKALRMPMLSQKGHSLVMVQMDTHKNEQKVLEKKSEIRSSGLKLDHLGIREMNDIMWWNLVQELTVVKRVVPLEERK